MPVVESEFIQDDLGEVEVEANPAALADPVMTQPPTEGGVYAAFAEAISGDGLIKDIFDSLPRVIGKDDPLTAFVRWPPGYATTEEPWGNAADPVTGVRENRLEDVGGKKSWTLAVNAAAQQRRGGLIDQAGLCETIAIAIDQALQRVLRTGTVVVSGGSTSVLVDVSGQGWDVNYNSAPWAHFLYIAEGTPPSAVGVTTVQIISATVFRFWFSGATAAFAYLKWYAVARK